MTRPGRCPPVVERGLVPAAGLVFLLVLAGAALLPPGFWVLDESIRYMQGTALLSSPVLPPPLLLPGAGGVPLDPRLAPVPFHYGRIVDGVVLAQYSPALALLSLPFRSLLGRAGTFAIPAAGAALCWLLLASAFLRNGFGKAQSLLLPFAGAPILFYGMTFWSHTLATGLVLASVVLTLSRRSSVLPVALVSAAVLFREEALPFLALPLLLGRESPRRRIAILACAGVVLLAASRLLTGEWLGSHVVASGSEQDLYGHAGMGWAQARLFVLERTLLTWMPGAPRWAAVTGGILLAGLWAVSAPGPRKLGEAAAALGLTLVAASLAAAAARGFRLLDALYSLKSPLIVFPALWLVRPRGRTAALAVGVLALALASMGPMHAEDLAWGSRLIMLPLMVLLLSTAPRSSWRTWAVIGVGLLACGVSVGFLAAKRARSSELVDLVSNAGGAVIVTDWLLAGEFAVPMERGVPVAFTPVARDFAEALSALAAERPVAVSCIEDLATQMPLFRELGWSPSIVGVVEFDPALRVAAVALREPGCLDSGP